MNDDDLIKKISNMSMQELMDFTYNNPSYLTDSYYSDFGWAMYDRYDQLKTKGATPHE